VAVAGAVIAAAVGLPFAVERIAAAVGPVRGPGTDKATADVIAAEALFGARLLDRKGRLLFPAHVVTRVWRDPGHCSRSEPGGDGPFADYRATVLSISWFGVPGSRIAVSCGGAAWTRL